MHTTSVRLRALLVACSVGSVVSCGGEVDDGSRTFLQGALSLGVTRYASSDGTEAFFNGSQVAFSEAMFPPPPPSHSPSCATSTEGDCVLFICNRSSAASSSAEVSQKSAGSVTFTGAAVSPLVFAPGSYQTSQPALPTDRPIFVGGEEITVTATGGDVPAFSLEVTAPGAVTVGGFQVSSDPFTAAPLDTSTDLHVTLSGGHVGQVIFSLQSQSSEQTAAVQCKGDVPIEGFTVSSAMLEQLAGVSPDASYGLSVGSQQLVTVGDWRVQLYLYSYFQDEQGQVFSSAGKLTLE